MSVLAYHYTHVPTIARFSDAHGTFVRGLMGPFGSGKSAGCVIELVKWAERQPVGVDKVRRARFAVIRNTYRQLEDTTMRTVEQWLPASAFGTNLKSEHRLVIDRLLPDLHMEILFRALDRPDHVSNLLSLELTGAWVNEAREVPWPIIQALMGRVGRYPSMAQGGNVEPGVIMDTNPPDDDSWWHKQFEEVRPGNWKLFRQPGGRAPAAENIANLRPGYYDDMASSADADFTHVYVDAEYGYVREGKPVYPMYLDSVHCTDTAEPNKAAGMDSLYFGWDFGLQPAFVMAQVLPNGRLAVFDEMVADSLGMHAFADAVLEKLATKYDWIDHAKVLSIGDPAGNATSALSKENETCFSILRGKGFRMVDGIQVVETRLSSVKHALGSLVDGRPRFMLHPRCRMLRRGFQGRYNYKRIQVSGIDPRYHDTPDKNDYSHPHDALQYIAARLFGNLLKGRDEARKRKAIAYPPSGVI